MNLAKRFYYKIVMNIEISFFQLRDLFEVTNYEKIPEV